MSRARHDPVLVAEVLRYLDRGPGLYLDATLGDAGHAEALLDAVPGARLLGCDRDPAALAVAAERLARFGDRVMLAHARFSELPGVARARPSESLSGMLFDLGFSSTQLDDPARGLSFQAEGPLDLRLDPERDLPAAQRLRGVGEEALSRVLAEEGDLPRPRSVARALLRAREAGRLQTTQDVVRALSGLSGARPHPRRLAQVFQALRRWVNDEGPELEAGLAFARQALRPGGALVAIAYHSGEDRVLKRFLRLPVPSRREARLPGAHGTGAWEVLTPRVVTPSEDEVAHNPRARSARLRAATRRST